MLDAASDTGSNNPALERYFERVLYLIVFMGFGTLATTGGLDLPTVLLVLAAFLFRGYLLFKGSTFSVPESWTNFLTLAYVAFYLADYFLISGAFLNSTIHLVLFVMVVRLFSVRRERDRYFLAVLAFLLVLAASVLTVDSAFVAAFAGFLLVAVAAFILMEMRHAAAKAAVRSREDPRSARYLATSLAAASPLIVLLILLGAGLIFFLLPRVSSGYLNAYARSSDLATGFSDRVQLGQIGQIQQSSAVVMHIRIDGDNRGAFDLKWRGVALNIFDGRTWSNPHGQHVVARSADGSFVLSGRPAGQVAAPHYVHYRVLMEPVTTNVFFLAARAQSLQGAYRLITTDGGGAVYDVDVEHPVSVYQAISDIARPAPDDLRRAPASYPAEILLDYLQLPALDPRIPRLAAQITAAAKDNYDRAAALETYLRTHFGYTLQLSPTPPADPLAEFLFQRKQGHCEYFASAMAVMLRTLGIPSRVVNGFRTGEFNDLTSQYVVRESDAHSWVEAYFPGHGWVSFDPTPAASGLGHGGWNRLGLYLDAMESFWREWVVNYDVHHQQVLGEQAARSGRQWFDHLQRWGRRRYGALLQSAREFSRKVGESPGGWAAGAAGLIALVILLGNIGRLWRMFAEQRLARHPEAAPRQAATIWYERMVRSLARRGWRKPAALTPREFAATIANHKVRQPVERFTTHYESARFGGSAQDAGKLPEAWEEVEASVRG